MEIEEKTSELITPTTTVEPGEVQEKDLNDDDQISLEKTIEVENSSLKSKEITNEVNDNVNSSQETTSENGKKKLKEEKPPSKIVVRRLPPTMTKDQFLEQVSPLPEVDYMYYVQGDVNNNTNPFSRAYLNFVHQEDLFSFSRTFDNYVFLDAKGQEFPAIVEFAMFQRVPKQRTKKKDPLIGTIESDPSFITFKENLLAEALENSKPGGKAIKQHYFETEISTTEEVNTTPLLEYLKVRRAEKARIREERREEKKRKELERKLKQKKDRKEGDEEESPKDVKIQHKQTEKHEPESPLDKNKLISEKEKLGKSDKANDAISVNESKAELVNRQYDKKISILKSDSTEKNSETEPKDFMINQKKLSSSDPAFLKAAANTKCDRFLSNNPTMGHLAQKVEELKIKEAEQQTMYLRKLLGLAQTDNDQSSNENEVSVKLSVKPKPSSNNLLPSIADVYVPEQLSKTEPPEEVLSAFKEYINVTKKKEILWSKHNINPALPSASFKTSNSSPPQGSSGEPSFEPRSLSAPRESSDNAESSDGGLGRQVASSTPNVSINQTEFSHKVFHVSRQLRKDDTSTSVHESCSPGEEVISSKDRRDVKDRENRNTKRKDEKEKIKETRIRDYKSRGGKSYQEERLKLAERREELKKKELQGSSEKRQDTIEVNDNSEVNDIGNDQVKSPQEKIVKTEKKRYDNRKGSKYDDDWKDDTKKRNRNEKPHSKRDGRDRKDDFSRRNNDKKNSDSDLRRKAKTYKGSELSKSDKKKTSSTNDDLGNKQLSIQVKKKEEIDVPEKKYKSLDDLTFISALQNKKFDDSTHALKHGGLKKRSTSLENSGSEKNVIENSLAVEIEKSILRKKEKNNLKDSKPSENNTLLRSRKDTSSKKPYMDEKSISSKNKDRSHEKLEDCKEEQCVKPSAQETGSTGESTTKAKEPSRSERRIRNKDRPSIEIYRPGMGKFSKQRLEKEKALGSSTEVESPSHSPSPTPKTKLIS